MVAVVAASKLAVLLLLTHVVKVKRGLGQGLSVDNANGAVQKLRDRLHVELPKPVELWGVKVGTGSRVLPAAEKALLTSYLRARDWSVDEAANMFITSLAWRHEFGVGRLRGDQFRSMPSERFAGRDKQGRLIVVLRISELDARSFEDLATFVRWRVHMQERVNERLGFGSGNPSYTLVLNCEGFSRGHFAPAARRCVGALSKVSRDNYPDFLGAIRICNPPSIFVLAFGVLRPFLPRNFLNILSVHNGDEASCIADCMRGSRRRGALSSSTGQRRRHHARARWRSLLRPRLGHDG